jgi:hypothetical protein
MQVFKNTVQVCILIPVKGHKIFVRNVLIKMSHPAVTQIGLLRVKTITRCLRHNLFVRRNFVAPSEAIFAVVLMSSCGEGRVLF